MNCPNCRLTVYAGPMQVAREECPRCAARLGRVSRLFRSELPQRLLSEVDGGSRPRADRPRPA